MTVRTDRAGNSRHFARLRADSPRRAPAGGALRPDERMVRLTAFRLDEDTAHDLFEPRVA